MDEVDFTDDLYPQAVEIVRENGCGRAGDLQRQLSIGYCRAARLIETLQKNNILDPDRNCVDGCSIKRV